MVLDAFPKPLLDISLPRERCPKNIHQIWQNFYSFQEIILLVWGLFELMSSINWNTDFLKKPLGNNNDVWFSNQAVAGSHEICLVLILENKFFVRYAPLQLLVHCLVSNTVTR